MSEENNHQEGKEYMNGAERTEPEQDKLVKQDAVKADSENSNKDKVETGKKNDMRPQRDSKRINVKRMPAFRRKQCRFCKNKKLVIDYKNVGILDRLITDRGKILPRRITGTCSKHQRALSLAIKRARILALLPFVVK